MGNALTLDAVTVLPSVIPQGGSSGDKTLHKYQGITLANSVFFVHYSDQVTIKGTLTSLVLGLHHYSPLRVVMGFLT